MSLSAARPLAEGTTVDASATSSSESGAIEVGEGLSVGTGASVGDASMALELTANDGRALALCAGGGGTSIAGSGPLRVGVRVGSSTAVGMVAKVGISAVSCSPACVGEGLSVGTGSSEGD